MKTILHALTLTLALGATAEAQAPESSPDSIWHSDWSKARALAKTQQKPLLVAFR